MRYCSCSYLSAALYTALTVCSSASADPSGEALFKAQCNVCHTIEKGGEKRQGPNLWAVFGRTVGSIPGFPYSNGLKEADWAWTRERMDQWLADPHSVFSDTYMLYVQKDPAVREQIISYLETKTD